MGTQGLPGTLIFRGLQVTSPLVWVGTSLGGPLGQPAGCWWTALCFPAALSGQLLGLRGSHLVAQPGSGCLPGRGPQESLAEPLPKVDLCFIAVWALQHHCGCPATTGLVVWPVRPQDGSLRRRGPALRGSRDRWATWAEVAEGSLSGQCWHRSWYHKRHTSHTPFQVHTSWQEFTQMGSWRTAGWGALVRVTQGVWAALGACSACLPLPGSQGMSHPGLRTCPAAAWGRRLPGGPRCLLAHVSGTFMHGRVCFQVALDAVCLQIIL